MDLTGLQPHPLLIPPSSARHPAQTGSLTPAHLGAPARTGRECFGALSGFQAHLLKHKGQHGRRGCLPQPRCWSLAQALPNDFLLLSSVQGCLEEIQFLSPCCGLTRASFPVAHKITVTFIGYMFCAKCSQGDLKERLLAAPCLRTERVCDSTKLTCTRRPCGPNWSPGR